MFIIYDSVAQVVLPGTLNRGVTNCPIAGSGKVQQGNASFGYKQAVCQLKEWCVIHNQVGKRALSYGEVLPYKATPSMYLSVQLS